MMPDHTYVCESGLSVAVACVVTGQGGPSRSRWLTAFLLMAFCGGTGFMLAPPTTLPPPAARRRLAASGAHLCCDACPDLLYACIKCCNYYAFFECPALQFMHSSILKLVLWPSIAFSSFLGIAFKGQFRQAVAKTCIQACCMLIVCLVEQAASKLSSRDILTRTCSRAEDTCAEGYKALQQQWDLKLAATIPQHGFISVLWCCCQHYYTLTLLSHSDLDCCLHLWLPQALDTMQVTTGCNS